VTGYLLFAVIEFLLLWVLVLRDRLASGEDSTIVPLLVAAGVTLLLLPMLHYGLFNDLVMRASIPALFLLLVGAAQALRKGLSSARTVLIAAVLAIGAAHADNLICTHLTVAWQRPRGSVVPPPQAVRNLFQMQLYDGSARSRAFVTQYLGATDSPFFHWLARPSPAADVTGPDPYHGGAGGRR